MKTCCARAFWTLTALLVALLVSLVLRRPLFVVAESTPEGTGSVELTDTATATEAPSATPTATTTLTPAPTETWSPTATATASVTPPPTPTASSTPSPTPMISVSVLDAYTIPRQAVAGDPFEFFVLVSNSGVVELDTITVRFPLAGSGGVALLDPTNADLIPRLIPGTWAVASVAMRFDRGLRGTLPFPIAIEYYYTLGGSRLAGAYNVSLPVTVYPPTPTPTATVTPTATDTPTPTSTPTAVTPPASATPAGAGEGIQVTPPPLEISGLPFVILKAYAPFRWDLHRGREFSLTLTLANLADVWAAGIQLTVESGLMVSLAPSEAVQLKPDGAWQIAVPDTFPESTTSRQTFSQVVRVIAADGLSAGLYKMPVRITYQDLEGNSYGPLVDQISLLFEASRPPAASATATPAITPLVPTSVPATPTVTPTPPPASVSPTPVPPLPWWLRVLRALFGTTN